MGKRGAKRGPMGGEIFKRGGPHHLRGDGSASRPPYWLEDHRTVTGPSPPTATLSGPTITSGLRSAVPQSHKTPGKIGEYSALFVVLGLCQNKGFAGRAALGSRSFTGPPSRLCLRARRAPGPLLHNSMDVFFEPGVADCLSLEEMLAGDIKSEFELGLGLGSEGWGGSQLFLSCSPESDGGLDDDWEPCDSSPPPAWATASLHGLDLSIDPAAGVMVNPNSVMPCIKRDSKREIKMEPEEVDVCETKPSITIHVKKEIKEEPENETPEPEEDPLRDTGDCAEEEEDEDDEDDDEDEEEDEEEEEEEEVEKRRRAAVAAARQREAAAIAAALEKKQQQVTVKVHQSKVESAGVNGKNQRNLWTTLITKPVNHHNNNSNHQRLKPHNGSSVESVTNGAGGNHQQVHHHQQRGPRYVQYQVKTSTAVASPASQHQVIKMNTHMNGKQKRDVSRGAMLDKYILAMEEYPKPAYSYSCLIAMALKNSTTGSLPVSEIYNFMCEHFPYFKSAPAGWKNSVRHNLSLNKCFEKIEKVSPVNGAQRKGCLWAMNPSKISKMDDEVAKWSRKDPQAIRRAMKFPETLEKLERGDMKIGARNIEIRSEESEESETESNQSSQISDQEEEEEDVDPGSEEDEGEVPPSLKPFDSRLNSGGLIHVADNLTNDLGVEFSDDIYEELGLLQQVLSTGEDEISTADLVFSTPTKRQRLDCVIVSEQSTPNIRLTARLDNQPISPNVVRHRESVQSSLSITGRSACPPPSLGEVVDPHAVDIRFEIKLYSNVLGRRPRFSPCDLL
ncbi:hypothetical protein AAG570_005195 [Ranatra chinensis]|uniref:Fork-head domain-containing protein n=1 Tax=Ranatra chinensis TaxID=642074 RepID=A0ABD0Y020_9HEMI